MNGLAGLGGRGAYAMGPSDYETGADVIYMGPLPDGVGVDPAPINVLGDDVTFETPGGMLDPLELPTLDYQPPPPVVNGPALAPGTFVNIAIGIAIGIVIDRLFLK